MCSLTKLVTAVSCGVQCTGHTDNCGVCSLTNVTAVHVSCGVRVLGDESGHTDNCGVCSLTKLVTAVHVSCGVRVLTDESGHTDNCGVCSLTKLVTAVHVTAVYVC